MHTEFIDYSDGETTLEGYLALDSSKSGPRPVVVVAHAWDGQNDFARKKAERLAGAGYLGFALDMYGKGVRGNSPEENAKLMEPFVKDRALLLRRIAAAVHTAREFDRADRHRIAAIGFCFGGMCVLDLARAGIDGVVGVVSLHGLLMPTTAKPGPRPMKARVLACHGYNDPMARPDAVLAFAKEMTDAGCDWTMMMFGHRGHAFTNPVAQFPQQGMQFCERAEHRSMAAMDSFLAECFADKQLKLGAVPVPA
ncbi:MAG: hypothetical protein FJ253_02985 [Phycisphaerae bacterium]|nr:hypothetical protein [Phycisphaerae bacterium]